MTTTNKGLYSNESIFYHESSNIDHALSIYVASSIFMVKAKKFDKT